MSTANLTNISGNATDEFRADGFFPFIVCMCIAVVNVVAFACMWRCKSIAKPIKIMTMNLLLSDIIYGMSFTVRLFYILDFPDDTVKRYACYFQELLTMGSNIAALFTITSMSLDRFGCLYYEMFYVANVTTHKVIIYYISVWILAFFISVSIVLDFREEFDICLPEKILGVYGVCVLLSLGVGCRIINGIAYGLVQRKIVKLNAYSHVIGTNGHHLYLTTYKILFVVLIWNIMYVPYFCYTIYVSMYPTTNRRFFVAAYFLAMMNSFVNPFIYVWRFPESRLQLKGFCCFYNRKVTAALREHQKRLQVSFLDK